MVQNRMMRDKPSKKVINVKLLPCEQIAETMGVQSEQLSKFTHLPKQQFIRVYVLEQVRCKSKFLSPCQFSVNQNNIANCIGK